MSKGAIMIISKSRRLACIALCILGATSIAFALDKPKDEVILTISGNVESNNAGGTADFDMNMLAALPQHSFTTKTPWYPTAIKMTGPLLRDVLAAAGAKGTVLTAAALNDYKTTIPAEDASNYNVIVARLMDGKPMPVRNKGPLFIIYPFSAHPELQVERYYGRSAWQLRSLSVK